MNKNQFLDKLRWRLFLLPKKEVDAAVSYYSEMIDDYVEDGLTEEAAVAKLGEIRDIVKDIKSDRTVSYEYVHKEYVFKTKEIELVKLIDFSNNIEINLSNDDLIHFHYYENEDDFYEMKETNKEFIITNIIKNRRNFYRVFSKPLLNRKITIEIPTNYKYDLSIESQNAAISCNSTLNLRELTAVTSNGSLNISNVTTENNLTLVTSNGSINCKNLTGYKIILATSNGAIRCEQLSAHNDLSIATSNGSVVANDIYSSNSISLKTSNGRLVSTINDVITNYDIESRTSNGSNNLPSKLKLGSKKLSVINGNGSINVTFLEVTEENTNSNSES